MHMILEISVDFCLV